MATVYSLLPTVFPMLDDSGVPLAAGKIYFYVAGSLVDKTVYRTATGSAWTQPVVLDAAGSATVFIPTGGIDLIVQDADGVQINRLCVEGLEMVAETALAAGTAGGTLATAGARAVTNGYTVLATDMLITVNSAAGVTVINLPDVTTRTLPVTIINIGANLLNITPSGTQTIQFGAAGAPFVMPDASAPVYPARTFAPDGAGLTWYVTAGNT